MIHERICNGRPVISERRPYCSPLLIPSSRRRRRREKKKPDAVILRNLDAGFADFFEAREEGGASKSVTTPVTARSRSQEEQGRRFVAKCPSLMQQKPPKYVKYL
jgi:hypothetical protein